MKSPLSSVTGSVINTDRISTASKQRAVKVEQPYGQDNAPSFQSASFRREVPMPHNAEFVEVDGKKYFLDAPRGTYVDIVV